MPLLCVQSQKGLSTYMFSLVILLALASTFVELTFASKFPAWRQAAKRNKAINLAVSIFLSFILGILFGAAGLIAMSAAIISTVLSVPGYAFLEWAYDSPQAQKHNGNQIKYYSDKWKVALSDLINLIYKFIKIITFPIWATRNVIIKLRSIKAKFVH